ncbi:GDYXXLXY domain-containing protein [Rariglobus hedericola]|uniref:GDYXXLXY domain-containing protein n=1 Tax=Rariglobus hedericola TaxID=2597822 RepID=A0A556QQ67_9BACT|nr:GDYXXLXY domain-containing protein [Rariglobus hedericola]TSJ78780.1 GDYXXLXY domain-containing protein [Rariglobus hedericola]
MNIKSARWVWAVVLAQVVFLLAWAGYHEGVRHTAPTVRLKTLPVDPRDILRGDYMILNYEISRTEKFPIAANGDVFVVLKPEGAHHVVADVLTEEPAADDPRLWVYARAWQNGNNLRLDYGIERFFVPEGRGTPRFTTLEVEAAVSGAHRLYIRHVWLDGKKFP